MEKWGSSIYLEWKYVPPPPLTQQIVYTVDVYGEARSRGGGSVCVWGGGRKYFYFKNIEGPHFSIFDRQYKCIYAKVNASVMDFWLQQFWMGFMPLILFIRSRVKASTQISECNTYGKTFKKEISFFWASSKYERNGSRAK